MPDSQRLAQHIAQAWCGSPIWLCTFQALATSIACKTMEMRISCLVIHTDKPNIHLQRCIFHVRQYILERKVATYQRLEMPYYLVLSYADLSMAQSKHFSRQSSGNYEGFVHNFALLSLNAAIVEGTLRSVLHWHLSIKQDEATKKGKSLGQTEPDLAERTLIRLRLDVDTSDTWSKLKSNFNYVFGKTLGDVVSPNTLSEIEHLFTIRNRAAHGSSIQIPKNTITEDDDEYLFALQKKLEKLTKYLNTKFGTNDIYEGLGHRNTASEFWSTTQVFASNLSSLYTFPPELQKNIDAITKYTFGKLYIGP